MGLECGTLLIGTLSSNKLDPPGHLPVNNIDGWSEYVRQLVSHFKGRIKYYEVWNEPPNFTGKDQTPADYAKLVRASCIAAKEADPDCPVGLTAKSAHIQYFEAVIKAGAADHFDWISLHPYERLDGIVSDNGLDLVYLNVAPTVRRMLAATNPAKQDAESYALGFLHCLRHISKTLRRPLDARSSQVRAGRRFPRSPFPA